MRNLHLLPAILFRSHHDLRKSFVSRVKSAQPSQASLSPSSPPIYPRSFCKCSGSYGSIGRCPAPPWERRTSSIMFYDDFFLSVIVWPVFFIDVEDIGDVKSLWDERSVHRLRFMTQTCFKKRQRTMLNRQMVKRMGMCIKEYRRKGKVESNKNEDYSFD